MVATESFPRVTEAELLSLLSQDYQSRDLGRITEAIELAKKAHPANIPRASGNLVLEEHVYEVTRRHRNYNRLVAPYDDSTANRLGVPVDNSVESVIADILHDALEDGIGVSGSMVSEMFGENVLHRVRLVTKPYLVLFGPVQDDSLRREAVNLTVFARLSGLDINITENWDSLVLKFCDAENSLETLPLPYNPAKQERIIEKMFRCMLPLAYQNSRHFYNSFCGRLSQLGHADRVRQFEEAMKTGHFRGNGGLPYRNVA